MPDRANIKCNHRQARMLRKVANQAEKRERTQPVPKMPEENYKFNIQHLALFRPNIRTYPLYAEGNEVATQFYTDVGSQWAGTAPFKLREFSFSERFANGYIIPKLDLFVRTDNETSWSEGQTQTINRETFAVADYIGNPVPIIDGTYPIYKGLVMLDRVMTFKDSLFSEYYIRNSKYLDNTEYVNVTFACQKKAKSAYHKECQLYLNAYYDTDNCGVYSVASRDLSGNETTTKDIIDSVFHQSTAEGNGLDNYRGVDRIYDSGVNSSSVDYAVRYMHGPGCGLMMTRKDYGIPIVTENQDIGVIVDSSVANGFNDAVQISNDYEVSFAGLPVPQGSDSDVPYNTYTENYTVRSACVEQTPVPNVVWLNAFWVDVEYVGTGLLPSTYAEGVRPARPSSLASVANVRTMGRDNTSSFSFTPWLWKNPDTGIIESVPGRSQCPFVGMFKYMQHTSDGYAGTSPRELANNQWTLYDSEDETLSPDYTIMYAFPIYVRRGAASSSGYGEYYLVDKFTPRQIAEQEEAGKYTTAAAERYQVLCCGYVIANTWTKGAGLAVTPAGATVLSSYDLTTTSRSAISSATLTTADQVSEPGANETIIPYVHSVTCDSSGELVVTMKYLHFNTGSSTVLASVTGSGDASTINYLSNMDNEGEE